MYKNIWCANCFFCGILFFSVLFFYSGCGDSESSLVSFSDVTVKALDLDTGNPIVVAAVLVVHYYQNKEHKIEKITNSSGEAYFTDVYVGRNVHIFIAKNTSTELYLYEGENISLKMKESQTFTVRIKNEATIAQVN